MPDGAEQVVRSGTPPPHHTQHLGVPPPPPPCLWAAMTFDAASRRPSDDLNLVSRSRFQARETRASRGIATELAGRNTFRGSPA
jgi:hypothetical protein